MYIICKHFVYIFLLMCYNKTIGENEMLNIKFIVDENILLRQMVHKNKMPTDFANYLWDKYNDSYRVLYKDFLSDNIDFNIFREIKQQSFFCRFAEKAKENCKRINNNFKERREEINIFLSKILRTNFSLNLTAYIVPPEFNSGINIGNNCFIWGHQKGISDSNYDLVYLVHESLHSFFDKGNLNHAIIEKIADIELAKMLNKTSLGYETHNYTFDGHVKSFPYWNLYLNRSMKEIEEEQKLLNIKYDLNKIEHYRENLSKMNINEFIKFLISNIDGVNVKCSYEVKFD